MYINSLHISKFRGFHDVRFNLGKSLTVIAGQNGTQKTTLLGMISQPFTITDKSNPIYGESPLCGGNYKSLFSEKFKLSEQFDLPKSHEWTLNLNVDGQKEIDFVIESISRRDRSGSKGIRFWKKSKRNKGSGYIQLPVIYLSLSRLFPIGEDISINTSQEIALSQDEFNFFKEWHNKILIIPKDELIRADYLLSKQKTTIGSNTVYYDWKMNSAGQDNIGKILLAILSFKRLKDTYSNVYKGGILVIDELDSTLYPASQIKLIEALRKFSSQLKIQIVFTTHSLTLLKKLCEWQEDKNIPNQTKVIYLQKIDNTIKAIENITYDVIKNKLNVALAKNPSPKKIPVFTEDKETEIFLKAIIKTRSNPLKFLNCTLGCGNLIELVNKEIVGFRYNESLIVLDGDVRTESSKMRKINQHKNILILPGNKSPERLLADFLHNLKEESELWDKICVDYTKQFAFKDYTYSEIQENREKAKDWFKSQKNYWGRNCSNVVNLWIKDNQESVNSLISDFNIILEIYNKSLIN